MKKTEEPNRLEKLEIAYDLAIAQIIQFCMDGNKDAGGFSACLPRIKQALDMERQEQGASIENSLQVRFSNNANPVLDPPAAEPDEKTFPEIEDKGQVEGLGIEETIEGMDEIPDHLKEQVTDILKEAYG